MGQTTTQSLLDAFEASWGGAGGLQGYSPLSRNSPERRSGETCSYSSEDATTMLVRSTVDRCAGIAVSTLRQPKKAAYLQLKHTRRTEAEAALARTVARGLSCSTKKLMARI